MIEWADYVHRLSDERDPSDRMRPFPRTHAYVAIRAIIGDKIGNK
jgi:hypothetical protein